MNTELFISNENNWVSFQEEHYRKVKKAEEEMLLAILTKYLQRIPEVEDYKMCQMVYRAGIDNQYTFSYKGVALGCIDKSFEDLRYTVRFTPIK